MTRAVVFVGPSLPPAGRPRLAGVEHRLPIKRGDIDELLAEFPGLSAVGVIDGVFHQSRAVSPREILALLKSGVQVLGASSMGALRAAELASSGMQGIGRIFEMYRRQELMSDDEVAITFDPETERALSEPLVNIRCAAASLLASGELTAEQAAAVVEAAAGLPYPERLYPTILRLAGRRLGVDLTPRQAALAACDQKREDALALYRRLSALLSNEIQDRIPRSAVP